MKIIDNSVVFSGRKGTDFQSCVFPQICILPTGRWLCTFRLAPTKSATTGQRPAIIFSDDQGKSWSEPTIPFKPEAVDDKPGLFRSAALTWLKSNKLIAVICWVDHSDPSLPFFNEQTEGLLDTRIFLASSEDMGKTWSKPQLIDTSPFNVPTPITGPVLELPNGCLACQFELNKHYYDTSPWRHNSVIMFSSNEGKIWPEHVLTSEDPENKIFYWDQRPGLLADGSILDLFWTYNTKQAIYLNIHARSSKDNGRTWSDMWDTGVPGQPATAVSLADGTIAMVYVDRTGPPTIKMRISSDGGKTWPGDSEIAIHSSASKSQTWSKKTMDDAWAEMGAFSIGLPATTQLPNGDILVVYYAGQTTDETSIWGARIRNH
ncbi:MAG: exo-alpha-sialidase [Sedimentisphaerales bacterium]|nr:exo-alpha-sialidase [Sedimentisphaerales bacterium]